MTELSLCTLHAGWRSPVASLAGMFQKRQSEPARAQIVRAVEQFPTSVLLATMGRLMDTLDEERRRLEASERERRSLERQISELKIEHARLTERLEAGAGNCALKVLATALRVLDRDGAPRAFPPLSRRSQRVADGAARP